MTTRIGLGLLLTALTAACGFPQANAADSGQAAAPQAGRQSKAETAAWQARAEAEFKTRTEDTGSITLEASDELIAQLERADPQARARAAVGLATAKGKRAVEPIMKALRSESDEKAYVAFIVSLDHLSDVRAVDGFVEALLRPGIPDKSREHALRSILRFRAGGRFVPEIRAFYDSLTDPDIRARVGPVVNELEK